MNFDIASELAGIYDLTQTIPTLTTFFIAASGIFLLCAAIGLVLTTKRRVGLRFFPVLYGFSVYILFYVFIGSTLSNLVSMMAGNAASSALVLIRTVSLLVSTAALVLGRFCAMWFLRKYYPEYCDAYGIGIGVSLTDGIITGATIFINYCLCMTINQTGLAALANSYESVAEATEQMASVWVFIENPSYFYILSGLESLMYLVFHTMVSVLFFAVYHGEMKKLHILTIIGLHLLMYLPGNMYYYGMLFNRITCFLAEALIFAGCILFFLRIHNTFYRNIGPHISEKPSGKAAPQKKMPNFNRNINDL